MAADLRIINKADLLTATLDLLQTTTGLIDETEALANAVMVALATDRLALAEDELPDERSDDRRGFWGDLDAEAIWGGWPLGSRLWLLSRAKITGPAARLGATIARAEEYVREALQPFVDNGIASAFDVFAERAGLHRIDVTVTVYRGPTPAIALKFQSLWDAS